MNKHPDGSVTLSKEELAELNHAYQQIMEHFAQMPFSIGDMFDEDTYKAIQRWDAQLDGQEYIDEDEEDDEEYEDDEEEDGDDDD